MYPIMLGCSSCLSIFTSWKKSNSTLARVSRFIVKYFNATGVFMFRRLFDRRRHRVRARGPSVSRHRARVLVVNLVLVCVVRERKRRHRAVRSTIQKGMRSRIPWVLRSGRSAFACARARTSSSAANSAEASARIETSTKFHRFRRRSHPTRRFSVYNLTAHHTCARDVGVRRGPVWSSSRVRLASLSHRRRG